MSQQSKFALEYDYPKVKWNDEYWTVKMVLKEAPEVVTFIPTLPTKLQSSKKDDSYTGQPTVRFNKESFFCFSKWKKLPSITYHINWLTQKRRDQTQEASNKLCTGSQCVFSSQKMKQAKQCLQSWLPSSQSTVLLGDREQWGKIPDTSQLWNSDSKLWEGKQFPRGQQLSQEHLQNF